MNEFLFLERELLGAIRTRSGILFSLAILSLFLFLAAFASFYLFPSAGGTQGALLTADRVVVYLSPRLSTAAIDDLFATIEERSDVREVHFEFATQVTPTSTGGRFLVRATSAAAARGLAAALRAMSGVDGAEVGTAAIGTPGLALSRNARIGLLCGLLVSACALLFLTRRGFRALLHTFRNEIRLMRLSGVSERTMYPPLVVLGLLMGALASVVLFVGLYVFQATTGGANPSLPLTTPRLIGVGLLSVLLGLLMGGLSGLFGASYLTARPFDPLP
jgi:cell division protein FtsX